MKLGTVKGTVKRMLLEFPKTRDDDRLLMLKVWAKQHPSLRIDGFSFHEFSWLFVKGKLASTEAIRRCRQKLQELHPELRGKNYKGKQKHQEDVKQEIKQMT